MKMNLYLWGLFLVLFTGLSEAQPITFSRTYQDTLNWSSISNDVLELNSGFYCLSISPIANTSYSMLLNVDNEGEINQRSFTRRNANAQLWGGATMEKASDGNFYTLVAERLISNPSKYNLNLCKYSTSLDTIWSLQNSDSTSEDFAGSMIVSLNKVFCSGYRRISNTNPSKYRGIMLISDENGNQSQFNEYNIDEISHGFNTITSGLNNSFYLGGLRYDSLYHGLVVKTDSVGNMLWHRWYPELWGANINLLSDSTYILTGSTPDGYSGRIAKINADGDVIWMKTFPFGTELNLYNSTKTTDGGMVSVGLTTVTTQNGNDAYIQKVDAEGNLLWQKSFNGVASQVDFFSNVIETYDGGLLVNGSTNEGTAGGQNLWLVKLDSMGCLEPDCWVGVEQADANTLGVAVYPNPATDWLYFKYDNTHKITLEIFNLSGQRVLQHQHMAPKEGIEISHLPSGLYLLRFVDEFGNVATEKLVVE